MTTPAGARARVRPSLVGWCPEHETYQPLEDGFCGFTDHDRTNGRLRKRRMYVCTEKGHAHGYFSRKDFLVHDHENCECC